MLEYETGRAWGQPVGYILSRSRPFSDPQFRERVGCMRRFRLPLEHDGRPHEGDRSLYRRIQPRHDYPASSKLRIVRCSAPWVHTHKCCPNKIARSCHNEEEHISMAQDVLLEIVALNGRRILQRLWSGHAPRSKKSPRAKAASSHSKVC